MDDSLDAFELPSLSMKKRLTSLKKKRNALSQIPKELKTEDKVLNTQAAIVESKTIGNVAVVDGEKQSCSKEKTHESVTNSKSNDTLFDVPELCDESFVSSTVCVFPELKNAVSQPMSSSDSDDHSALHAAKDVKLLMNSNNDHCVNSVLGVAEATSSSDIKSCDTFCKVCSMQVPEEECKDHVIFCMKKIFSSKRDLKLQLENHTACPTCGICIKICDYEIHFEICTRKNLEAALAISDEKPITSSYFKPTDNNQLGSCFQNHCVEDEDQMFCPSCGKDMAALNPSSKLLHVNRLAMLLCSSLCFV